MNLWEMLQEEMGVEQRRLLVEAYRRLRGLVDEGVTPEEPHHRGVQVYG